MLLYKHAINNRFDWIAPSISDDISFNIQIKQYHESIVSIN